MAIQTSCPHCRKSYSLAENQEGKTVRCKNCSESFVVRDFSAEEEPRKPRPKKKGMPTGLLIAGGIGIFVVCMGCLGGGGALLWIYGPFGNKVTKENFDKIQNGMTEAEVKAILGEPNANNEANLNRGGARVDMFGMSILGWKHGDNVINVTFLNGKVAGKKGQFITGKRR